MIDPVFVVGIHKNHAEIWADLHIKSWERKPVPVYPANLECVFAGVRDRIILILPEASIPDHLLKIVAGRNTIIDLNER